MRFTLRYDMRVPDIGAPAPELYRASVEMAEWADRRGFETVYLAEHHGADDGYCPSPIVQATAIAARTKRLRLHLSALIAVLHHPLRLAEDLAILDIISGGRVELTLGLGYRPHEYEMFGVDRRKRVELLDDTITILGQAWTGEPFDFRGQSVVIRPVPVQRPGPPIHLGGSTEASALRAARQGMSYLPATAELTDVYFDELRRLGRALPQRPPKRGPLFLHVSEDPERDWTVVAPHLMYTSNTNAQWAKERGRGATPYPHVSAVDDLEASSEFAVVTPEDCITLARELGPNGELLFQPLMGGLFPDVGWRSLELFERSVLPTLSSEGYGSAADSEIY